MDPITISLGVVMLYGMIAGGTGNAVYNSSKGLSDACDSLKTAESELADAKDKWNDLIFQQQTNLDELTSFQQSMANGRDALNRATLVYHNSNIKRQRAINIGIVSLLIAVLTLIFIKKVKLFKNIKKLIFG